MDRDNLVKECDRLLNLLGTGDPASEKYRIISERLRELFKTLLTMDSSAQDLLDKERQIEIEFKKIEVEEIKIKVEQLKLENQKAVEEAKIANETRRLDIEEEHYKNEQQEAERRLDIEELKANTEAEDVKQRRHYTMGECIWGIAGKVVGTILTGALITHTGRVQEGAILDKNLFSFIQKPKLY